MAYEINKIVFIMDVSVVQMGSKINEKNIGKYIMINGKEK